MEKNCMSSLMVSCNLLFFVRDNSTLLLCSYTNLNKRTVNILLNNIFSILLSCIYSRFIKKVLKICTCKSYRWLCYPSKINIITKSLPQELVIEDNAIKGLVIKNVDTGELSTVECAGIFPYMGADPATGFLKNLNILDERGYIVVNKDMETAVPGIYGAGDVTVKDLRQVVTATNDGAIAANACVKYLNR